MNTPTTVSVSDSSVAAAPASASSPAIDDLNLRLSALDSERTLLLRQKEEREAEIASLAALERQRLIDSLPATFGVPDIAAVIALLRQVATTPAAVAPATGGPNRIPATVLAQMKEMLVKGGPDATARLIAKHLRVSIATVRAYKARWGLTEGRRGKKMAAAKGSKIKARRPHRKGATKSPYLTDDARSKLVVAIAGGKTSVRQLAKQFGVSRQTVYNVAEKAGVRVPGYLTAASKGMAQAAAA